MKRNNFEQHVLPRPVDRLPDYPQAKARVALAERLVESFSLDSETAMAISNAVVDPTSLRKSIGDPVTPNVEEIRVPGGVLLGLRAFAWSRRVMPDPRNPRIGPSRKHPFAVEPGKGGEDSLFRPVPEPRSLNGDKSCAQLAVDVESRHHITWAAQQAAKYVLAENDWRRSIASQGVMEPVWLVATSYVHRDGSAPATALVSVEGSSRMTAVHDLLNIRSADVAYDVNDVKLRAHYKRVNEAFNRGPEPEENIVLRCEIIPALIIVGLRVHANSETTFPTAIKSLVALRHVDPPKPWGDGPENESLADEVLDELLRRGLITETQHDYFAGACTREEAAAAHLSIDSTIRAAQIVRLLTEENERTEQAVRVAVTSQSTRKRITSKLCDELATALILRGVDDEPSKVDQVRRYLKESFGKASHKEHWQATLRPSSVLSEAATREVREWIAGGQVGDPGPDSLELAVRAAYPYVVTGKLNADRGSAHNEQPDRRNPGEVLDVMRRSPKGVLQLRQGLVDYEVGQSIRAVDEDGDVLHNSDGGEVYVNDIYLRNEYPPHGRASAPRCEDTPTEKLKGRIYELEFTIEALRNSFLAVGAVVGNDNRPLVDSEGVSSDLCIAWREILSAIDDELNLWNKTFMRRHGTSRMPSALRNTPVDDIDEDQQDDPAESQELVESIAD